MNLRNLTSLSSNVATLAAILTHSRLEALHHVLDSCIAGSPVQIMDANPEIVPGQRWNLSPAPDGFDAIVASASCGNTFLTYGGKAFGVNGLHTQASTLSIIASTWNFSPTSAGDGSVNIKEVDSGLYLTAWNADPRNNADFAPLTLENLNNGDVRQAFWVLGIE